jgi:hypothetical protein
MSIPDVRVPEPAWRHLPFMSIFFRFEIKRLFICGLAISSFSLLCLAQESPRMVTRYLPAAHATGVTLVGLFAKADLTHGVTQIGIGVSYLCSGHDTRCPGAEEAGLSLDAVSFGSGWVFQSQRPVRVSFSIDGRKGAFRRRLIGDQANRPAPYIGRRCRLFCLRLSTVRSARPRQLQARSATWASNSRQVICNNYVGS